MRGASLPTRLLLPARILPTKPGQGDARGRFVQALTATLAACMAAPVPSCRPCCPALPRPAFQGPVVSLLNHVPEAANDSGSELSAAPSADEFPPLPSSALAAGNGVGSSGGAANPGPAAAPAGAAAGTNPLLAAFAAERQAMEQLRDDVQAKLASLRVRRKACAFVRAAGQSIC